MPSLVLFFYMACFETAALEVTHSTLTDEKKVEILYRLNEYCKQKAVFMSQCQRAYMKKVIPKECKLIKL